MVYFIPVNQITSLSSSIYRSALGSIFRLKHHWLCETIWFPLFHNYTILVPIYAFSPKVEGLWSAFHLVIIQKYMRQGNLNYAIVTTNSELQ